MYLGDDKYRSNVYNNIERDSINKRTKEIETLFRNPPKLKRSNSYEKRYNEPYRNYMNKNNYFCDPYSDSMSIDKCHKSPYDSWERKRLSNRMHSKVDEENSNEFSLQCEPSDNGFVFKASNLESLINFGVNLLSGICSIEETEDQNYSSYYPSSTSNYHYSLYKPPYGKYRKH